MIKELEALERLYCAGRLDLDYVSSPKHNEDFAIIEKPLKALKIIKEKMVNVGYFIHRLEINDLSYEEYVDEQNSPYLDIYVSVYLLNIAEYNLLKKVLL